MSDAVLYAAQRPIVKEIIEREGVYHVKRRFIDMKYGESAWIFNEAYSFFRQKAAALVPCPPEAESAVWLYCDPRMAAGSEDAVFMRLRIPEEKLIFFDSRLWSKVLNLKYIGRDDADEKAFEKELGRMGLSDSFKVFSTSFYPLQKQKIKDSWMRLFDSANCPELYRQAAAWELRKEWLIP